jgi:hypothetical protein
MVEGVGFRADFAIGINLGLVPTVRKVSTIRTVSKSPEPRCSRAARSDPIGRLATRAVARHAQTGGKR